MNTSQPERVAAPTSGLVASSGPPMIDLVHVTKSYKRGSESLQVLQGVTLQIKAGSFVAFMGPSGSGKSTLLNIVAGLDQATSGTVRIANQELSTMNAKQLAGFRAHTIGFVFQTFNLIPVLTAVENVELPLLLHNLGKADRRRRAETALKIVGLEDRMGHYPNQLSGGQEQRVAIARAIVHDPPILVGDEPTGDLDRKSADEVLGIFQRLNQELGKTILMVTHDPAAASRAHVLHSLDKGILVEQAAGAAHH